MSADKPIEMSDDEYIQMMLYLPEKLNKCVSLLADKYLQDSNIKVYYIPYILNLKYKDGMSQKDLKCHISCDKSRISVVVHELMNEGFVYNDATGRNSSLHLTEKGHSAYTVCKMFFDIVKKEVFGLKTDEDLRKADIEFNQRLDALIEKYSQH